jgi:hypothetical protein
MAYAVSAVPGGGGAEAEWLFIRHQHPESQESPEPRVQQSLLHMSKE